MTLEKKPVHGGEIIAVQDAAPAQGVVLEAAPRRRLSWFFIVLPLILTPPWVLFLSLFKLAEDVFSIPGALMAGVLLSAVLLAIRRKGLPLRWALLPLLCWLYECLPITLPGPIDELLAVGGSGMDVFWAWVKKPEKGNPPKGSLT